MLILSRIMKKIFFTAALMIGLYVSANAQVTMEMDTLIDDPNSVVFKNAAQGEFTPGRGFQLVKNKFASLNFSLYAMARYVNQLPGNDQWEDHQGNVKTFDGRQDFYWHRTMLWFTGYLGTPKLTYMATVWTVFTTQQSLVYGNIGYAFSDRFRLAIGITPNFCIRSLQGSFPYFTATDRTMAEDAIRGGFTNGLFATGELFPGFRYGMALGNNLSNLGIVAGNLTRNLSKSVSVSWMPTTHEFGPRGGNGDFEHHEKLATRFGGSFVHSRENRFNNIGTPSPDNTQVRMSDGVLFFETGSLAPGVTISEADFDLFAVDIGFKYKGLALHTEFYYRTLSDIAADGAVPYSKITDKGYTVQLLHMVLPKKLCVYALTSGLVDEFGRNPYEVGGGVNVYPYKTRSWRLNAQALYVYKAAAGGTFGLYTAGQTGANITIGTDIIL
jgi:hypothetical protein